MRRLKVAVIGTGFIGPVHAEAIRRNAGLADLVMIAGISDQEAEEAALRLNVPGYTSDYRDILKSDVDVVHICTPNHLHYSMVKACLEAGKSVLCEKPLAMNSEEAAELVQLAEEKGLKAAVNYNLRYYPLVQEMRQRNIEKDGGEIFSIQGSYLQDWLLYETDYSWRLESKLSGRSRAVADIGTHWMDMAQYVTGMKIKSVFAQFGRMHETRKKSADGKDLTFSKAEDTAGYVTYDVDTEDYAQILIRMDNGTLGNLTVSQVTAGYKNFMEFRQSGTGSSFSWNSEAPNQLIIGHRDRPSEILVKDPSLLHGRAASMSGFPGGHQEGYGETLKNLIREFYSDVLGRSDQAEYPSLKDGASEMYLCEAIISSAEEERWVEVKA